MNIGINRGGGGGRKEKNKERKAEPKEVFL